MIEFLKNESKLHGAVVTTVSFAGYRPSSAIEIDPERNILLFSFEHAPDKPGAQADAVMQAALLMVDGLIRRRYSDQLMQCRNRIAEAISYFEINKFLRKKNRKNAENEHERPSSAEGNG